MLSRGKMADEMLRNTPTLYQVAYLEIRISEGGGGIGRLGDESPPPSSVPQFGPGTKPGGDAEEAKAFLLINA